MRVLKIITLQLQWQHTPRSKRGFSWRSPCAGIACICRLDCICPPFPIFPCPTFPYASPLDDSRLAGIFCDERVHQIRLGLLQLDGDFDVPRLGGHCHFCGVDVAAPHTARHTRHWHAYQAQSGWRYRHVAVVLLDCAYAFCHCRGAQQHGSVWLAAIVLLLSWWQTRTLLHPKLFAAVLLGFVGVVLLLDPRGHHAHAFALWPVVAGLTAGVLAAIAYMQVQSLGQAGEPNTRTVFYFSIGTALMGLVGCLVFDGGLAMPRQGNTLGWLLAVGVLAAIGQWCLTRAYSRGATLVVANLQYLGLVFSALMGVWLFHDKLSLINWLGIATIILSSIAATILRPKQ